MAPSAGPPVDETAEQAPAEQPGGGGTAAPWSGLSRRARIGIGAGVAAAIVGGFMAGRSLMDAEPAAQRSTTTTTAEGVAEEFVTFRDAQAGFAVEHPKGWKRIDPPHPDVRLLLSAGGYDSFLVRVIPLESPVTAENLGDVKAVTDAAVTGEKVQILQQRTITLNGMPGYYYLYAFNDAATGQQGVHAHYFLFQGRTMNVLVFQALPSENFRRLADTFDRIAETFTSTAPPTTTTTTG